ncbi:MAG: aminotransferase class I/II-fold pyridoxal phosphate-dependent enzyme [Hyphomicrobiaceae bacterium]
MNAAAAAEAEGRDIIHMEVGQPATPAPRAAREAAKLAIDKQSLGYTVALGLPALRHRIARHYQDWYGVKISSERVVVTSGSSAAFVLAFLAAFDQGDVVAVPAPGYPCYRHILSALGQQQAIIPTGPDQRWMPTQEQINNLIDTEDMGGLNNGNLAGLLIASPANPTGTMMEEKRLSAICDLAAQNDMWLISDEIYHGLAYERPAKTALEFSDDAIVINSFSKYFSMTGWRVGWMVLPEALVPAVERLAQNLYICPSAVAQAAALGAFDGFDELERNRAQYSENRKLIISALPTLGIRNFAPADGAFYIYADVSQFTQNSLAFARAILEHTNVSVTSGLDFDENLGHRYLRLSYAGATDKLDEAIGRLDASRLFRP